MNSKRSYLENLNAGRQRRDYASLEELNRSMEALEQRIGRNREEPSRQQEPRYGRSQPYAERYDAPRHAQRPYEDQRPRERDHEGARGYQRAYQEPRPYRQGTERPYQSIARDIERMRGQEDGVAMVSKIANELRGLREELRQQMSSGLQREFEALRKDIQRAAQEAPSSRDSAELGLEFERLSGAIRGLAEKSDDKSVNLLRLELEQVRKAMDTLAREESVQAVDRRWQEFDQRWSAFENRFDDSAGKQDGVGVTALAERLEQIGAAVNKLPESLSLRSLEEKVRTLAGAVDHFASQQGRRGGDVYGMIDERLDEISRAIVASTVAAQSSAFDPAPFERIEQRIASLARQIEEVTDERPRGEVMDHLFHGFEQRFEALSGIIERRQDDAMQQGSMLFRDLERRLDDVADRLERRAPEPGIDNAGIMDAIDARFSALAQRLESRGTDNPGQDAIRSLESRLDDISSRLDSSSLQSAGIDADLLRSLEAQISGLSTHLSRPGAPLPEFEDIGPRIEKIEESIATNRDTILETARQAAENAVRALGLSNSDTVTVAGLAGDLKTLEGLTRRSDERNTKTFEAIHDTLLKIVDRLGSLEVGGVQPSAPKITVQDAPALDMDEPLPLSEPDEPAMRGGGSKMTGRTPAQAAAEAARAALGSEAIATDSEISGQNKSMFGGIARAFKMRRESETQQPTALSENANVPTVDLDGPLEPRLLNRPLEPGSGAPDLNAIMKRVRDERGQPARQNTADASKADFIAAARRAAQAAAAEAEALKHQSGKSGGGKSFGLGNLLKARRKPILMAAAAVMLALAGLQLGKAFLSDPEQVSLNEIEQETDAATMEPTLQTPAMAPVNQAPMTAEAPALPIPADAPPVRSVDHKDLAQPGSKDDLVAPQTADAQAAPEAVETAKADPAPAAPALIAAPVTLPTVDVPGMVKSNVSTEDKTGAVSPDETATNPAAGTIEIPQTVGPAALRDAAAAGDAKALFEIGSRYAEARGVKEDMVAAAKWYGEAAERGFAPAEYRIGNFYEKGIGVERDIAKSKEWYRRAAEKGNASAMHNLAVLFAMGADGAADNDAATRWFQQAADRGVKDSQFNLGILAAKGAGMQQNLEESYKWFALVAKSGDKDAAAKRDEIAKALRPEQLERAKQVTDLWKPKPLDTEANSIDMPSAWQDAPTTIAGIDMKKAVQNIQRILAKNGYDSGGTDGVMGDRTKKAIMAFQSDNGLEANGSVDEKLVKALLAKK